MTKRTRSMGSSRGPQMAALLASGLACHSAPSEPVPSAPPPVIQPTAPKRAIPPNPSALERPKKTVVVGGCLLDCDTAARSLVAFLRATLSGDRLAVQRHLDTSMLIDRGQHLGDRWADQWESGRLAERNAEIDVWLDQWATLSTTWIDPGDRTHDPKFTIDSSEGREHTATWWVPEQASGRGPTLPRSLRLTLGRRGLEWLVCRIDGIAR